MLIAFGRLFCEAAFSFQYRTFSAPSTMSDSTVPTTDWNLAPAPESTSHVQIAEQYDLFIGGKFVKSTGNQHFDSINPATEQAIAKVTEATSSDVDKAVKAARKC